MFTPNTLPLILVVLLIYFILLIAPTSLYVEAAREKGYYQNKSTAYLLLWGYMSPDCLIAEYFPKPLNKT